MKKIGLIGLIAFSPAASGLEQVKIGGFVDTYYAYDFNAPKDHEREYTTQPARHNEFNINLAYFDAQIKQEKTRGRLALQLGNSVTKNTENEPIQGNTSGQDEIKYFQEAYIGKKINEKTWIDGGIFFGHIGAESWISMNNWTYSRSLNLDYVPYYSAGLRMEHQLNQDIILQLHFLNGWQNVTENNNGKSVGMKFQFKASEEFIFTYNNFFGDEEVVPNPATNKTNPRFRSYHNFIFQWLQSMEWQYLLSIDFGHQAQQNNDGADGLVASSFTVKKVLNEISSLAFRIEYYNDPHQTNVFTNTEHGFEVIGASANYDQKLDTQTLWRTELRGFYSKDKIYPTISQSLNRLDGLIVTSLAIKF